MNKSQSLFKLGQSIWFDNVDRSLINNGWFAEQIKQRTFVGVTSNPSIFQKSISKGTEYSLDIQTMSWSNLDANAIYERLAIADIRDVADLLAPVYEETGKKDGYVSLEVDPLLANNPTETVREAKRLWKIVDRRNLMVKIPATPAGIFAIKEVIAEGINVNVTLIFSTQRYLEVLDAYYSGLEERIKRGDAIDHIHSVASFFISRMDVMIEDAVAEIEGSEEISKTNIKSILGKVGIQNAQHAYAAFEESIASDRFQKIKKAGGNLQRPLWASTGTKNPEYSDLIYVDALVLPHTVNTVPPSTLQALLDHGKTDLVVNNSFRENFEKSTTILESAGYNLEHIFQDLEIEGVEKFSSAQNALLNIIELEREKHLEQLAIAPDEMKEMIQELVHCNFISRFYQPDVTLFTKDPDEEAEVLQRFGWIDAPTKSRDLIEKSEKLRDDLIRAGFSHTVVLGMGGSSLAPEVFSKVFESEQSQKAGLKLSIIDSTDPIQIQSTLEEIPIKNSLFIASSKSGTTAEMNSLTGYILKLLKEEGASNPGNNFICITDPGTPLESFAKENNFRAIFHADANVGGRYSALIAFGVIPAILAGVDANKLLDNAARMQMRCSQDVEIEQNPAFVLATILSEAYSKGTDKLTILADEPFTSFGSWLEQLVAESSGKNGNGLTPIDGEPILDVSRYSDDRIFYYLRHDGSLDGLVDTLHESGFSALVSDIHEPYDIAGEMYKWEIAVAAFCSMMGVNPFNQPNVQASKLLSVKMLEAYRESPVFDEGEKIFENDLLAVYGAAQKTLNPGDKIIPALFSVKTSDYISINAFLPRISVYQEMLQAFRLELMHRFALPVTLGFGPRFLHSTGQLHKGGKNNGIFLVLTQDTPSEMMIPGDEIPFSILEKAQALGDMRALEENGRRVVRFHFKYALHPEMFSALV